eukprot:3799595-Karenia_brevis.AAC.1
MDPLEYRILLITPVVYRLWAKTRLQSLQPWVQQWQWPQMYAGREGASATDAWYSMAIDIELA